MARIKLLIGELEGDEAIKALEAFVTGGVAAQRAVDEVTRTAFEQCEHCGSQVTVATSHPTAEVFHVKRCGFCL